MARAEWEPGAVIRKTLDDGKTYYGRLLEFPWAVFYDLGTDAPLDDPGEVVASKPLFTLAAHKDLLDDGQWEPFATVPLDGSLRPPAAQFIQDPDEPSDCQIIDDRGDTRPATPGECEGLEPAAVWEPEHIADRLIDHHAGRPNQWLESTRLRETP